MKIVVLDGYCLNHGDLSWDRINSLADLTVYDRTGKKDLVERAKDADIVLINKIDFNKELIDNLPKLKYIGVMATGYNVVDCDYARKKGIDVSNIPSYGTESVVQAVYSLLFEVATAPGYHNLTVKRGDWVNSNDFCYYRDRMVEISGKTMGIVGYGRIGQRVAEVARAFNMNVIVYNIDYDGKESSGGIFVSFPDLLKNSDVISLNCPLTASNKGMINKEAISLMKENAIIINTARGPLINEQDLADALNSERIFGAGLDVLSEEPPSSDNPLLYAKNIVITPHTAWATKEARSRLMDILYSNIEAFINGKKQNIVNN